jgi:hypothetical protein
MFRAVDFDTDAPLLIELLRDAPTFPTSVEPAVSSAFLFIELLRYLAFPM